MKEQVNADNLIMKATIVSLSMPYLNQNFQTEELWNIEVSTILESFKNLKSKQMTTKKVS